MSHDQAIPFSDHDSSLLEGLFELVLSGHTGGSELDKLTAEVYSRLETTYADGHEHHDAELLFSRSAA